MKEITLFYKRLIKPGGAERLLLKEYINFKSFGYKVTILTFEFNIDAPFFMAIDKNDVHEISNKGIISRLASLALFQKRHCNSKFICNSGYVDFYLATVFSRVKFYLHLHQPSFMSFNETDKYSAAMNNIFELLVDSNYGADRFSKIKNSLSIIEKIYINLRSFISIKGVKSAELVFVLSDYAVREKKIMYGVDSINITGALDESIFNYVPKNIENLSCYKNKLLTIARLDKNKRIDELIRAFAIFLKENPDSLLVIGGTGEEYEYLAKLIITLEINDNVILQGFIPDDLLYDYYSWADLFISIDWADFRITSFEAMAMGTKVLLSDETDADEVLLKSGYYYLTTPKSKIVAQNIYTALNNKQQLPMSELYKLLTRYTWQNYFSKMEKYINA